MVVLWRAAAGAAAVALGLAWVVAPIRMSKLQAKVLYVGVADDDYDRTDTQVIAGRISGLLLAVLGVALALGLLP